MKCTPWRKPIGDCGGINTLVQIYWNMIYSSSPVYFNDIVLHAYREVGTSLECAIEIRAYCYKDSKKIIDRVYLKNITI